MLLIGLGFLLCLAQLAVCEFPKILWSYWEQGYNSTSLFTRLCLNNKQYIASKNGWEFRLLSKDNYTQYINKQILDPVYKKLPRQIPQARADLIRVQLMLEHGGMWIDANSYFSRDLEWVMHPQESSLLGEKIRPNPNVIIGAYTTNSQPQHKRIVFDQDLNMTVNVKPLLQNWFFLSMPNQTFFRDMWNTIREAQTIGYDEMENSLRRQNIHFETFYHDPYFFAGDYPLSITIQRKQNQLDKDPNSPIKYAMDYYKMWHFQAHDGPYMHLDDYDWKSSSMWADLGTYTPQEILAARINPASEQPYFSKYNGAAYMSYDFFLSNYARLNCWGYDRIVSKHSQIGHYLLVKQIAGQLTADFDKLNEALEDQLYCVEVITEGRKKTSSQADLFSFVYFLLPVTTALVYYYFYGFLLKDDQQRGFRVPYGEEENFEEGE